MRFELCVFAYYVEHNFKYNAMIPGQIFGSKLLVLFFFCLDATALRFWTVLWIFRWTWQTSRLLEFNKHVELIKLQKKHY